MNLISKLRYMGKQYSAGQKSRGGGDQKHYLEEAADRIEYLEGRLKRLGDETHFDFVQVGDEQSSVIAAYDRKARIQYARDTEGLR